MIEVCFCDSLAGWLNVIGNKVNGYSDSFGKVEYLFLPLYLGDLRQGVFSKERMKWVHSVMKDEWRDGILFTVAEQRKAIKKIQKIKQCCSSGEGIRVWYSNSAEDLCAFHYLMSELDGLGGEITCICKNSLSVPYDVRYHRLGAVPPEELLDYLPVERILAKDEINWAAETWRELCKGEFKLRVNINGELVGVPITFYDSGIIEYIPKDVVFKPYRVVGEYLVNIPAGLDSFLVEWRLSEILHNGDYEVVGEPRELPENSYCEMLNRLSFRYKKQAEK